MSNLSSEEEGRSLIKSFASLRITLNQMDRSEDTVGSMYLTKQVTKTDDTMDEISTIEEE